VEKIDKAWALDSALTKIQGCKSSSFKGISSSYRCLKSNTVQLQKF